MIIQRLFSKEDKDKKSNKTRNSLILGAGLNIADSGLSQLNNKRVEKLEEDWKKEAKDKESKKVYSRLKKREKRLLSKEGEE